MFSLVRRCLTILLVSAGCLSSLSAGPARKEEPRKHRAAAPAARITEMLDWLAYEQLRPDEAPAGLAGGYTWLGHVGFSAGKERPRTRDPGRPDVADTAMVALALLRTGNTPTNGKWKNTSAAAVAYVERIAEASQPYTLRLSSQPSPLTVRIGPHVDTFFALWLLAELRQQEPKTEADPLMAKLIEKLERNINADGSWGDPDAAQNSPLLGHAIGVRALETAARKGFRVNEEILARAERYALTEDALKHERSRSGKWKPNCGGFKPDWLIRAGAQDMEPINEAAYVSAARMCVVDQADRTNALKEKAIRDRLTRPASNAELAKLAEALKKIVATRKTLAAARGQMLTAFGDKRSAAPLVFCAEDYLAALLTVDAMGAAAVEQWFPPTVKDVMFIQDVDGGLKSPDPIECHFKCRSTAPPYLCKWQLAFTTRDRVFCTAAGLAIVCADTLYRRGFLDPDSVK